MTNIFLRLSIGFVALLLLIMAGSSVPNLLTVNLERPATANCPVRFWNVHGMAVSKVAHHWTLNSEPETRAPEVAVAASENGCLLALTRVPQPPFKGIDWRLGLVVTDPAISTARKMQATVVLSADPPMTFESAFLYSYDGSSIVSTQVRELSGIARRINLDIPITPGSKYLELWLRLTIHGTISNTGTVSFQDIDNVFKE